MRCLKLIVAGLVLAVAATAGATSGPPFGGTFYAHMDNYDASRLYTGYLADGVTPATPGFIYTDPDNELEYTDPPGAWTATETSWGVFRFQEVFRGEVTGPNTITKVPPSNVIWSEGDGGKELVGIFYGRQDKEVSFATMGRTHPSTWYQFITSDNDTYKMWFEDWNVAGSYDNGDAGTAARSAEDHYDSIGDIAGQTDPVLIGHNATDITTTFDPLLIFPSSTLTYIELDSGVATPGYWQPTDSAYFVRAFPCGGSPAPDAHIKIIATLSASSKADWTVSSSDPITGTVIPEPLTMLGLFVGIGGLAGYVRNRR